MGSLSIIAVLVYNLTTTKVEVIDVEVIFDWKEEEGLSVVYKYPMS